jgi:hypothetical protein
MRKSLLTIPEIALIGATRVALGAGLALLLGEKLDRKERRAVGWTLFLTGVATTVPLVLLVLDKKPSEQSRT